MRPGKSVFKAPRRPPGARPEFVDDGDDEDPEYVRMSKRMGAADFMDDDEEDDEGEDGNDDDESVRDRGGRAASREREVEEEEVDDEDGVDEDEDEEEEYDDLDDEEYGEAGQDEAQEEVARLENELSGYSFGELLKVQETMGLKKFKKLRSKASAHARDGESGGNDDDDEEDEGDDDEDEDDERPSKPQAVDKRRAAASEKSQEKALQPKKKRNPHAPLEITSKRPVSRNRVVVPIAPATKRFRDPRFSELSGEFNQGLFKNSYRFLEDYQKSEMEDIQKRLKKTKNREEVETLQAELRSMVSKKKTEEDLEKKKKVVRDWRKAEAEAVKEGKKPYFLKKTDVKKLVLVDKFKSMTPAQVEKAVEKRRKDNAQREKRFMPYARRSK